MVLKMRPAVYFRPLLWAFGCQILVWLYANSTLDLGHHHEASLYASGAFWVGVLLIMVRRQMSPTPGDLRFIRWGLLVVGIGGTELIMWAWELRGVG